MGQVKVNTGFALYGSKAISSGTPSFNTNYLGNSVFEDQRIASWKRRGNNLVYLSNTNLISSGGFMGTTYTAAGKTKLKAFIKKCYAQGIKIGVVGGVAYGTGPNYGDAAYNPGPALRVVDYNTTAAFDEKIENFLIEEEFWRPLAGNMTFAQFLSACQSLYALLNPAGVSNDVYIVRRTAGQLASLAPYIDIFWLTTYLSAANDNQPRYDGIHPWVVELAGTTPSTPIKVGALISIESYSYNKTGGTDSGSNFSGYWMEGRRIDAPFVSPQPIVTSNKNLNQMSDKITHNGTVGLPPIDFNSEPSSVTNYIEWMGTQLFDDDLAPNLNILDANTNEVYAFGDGSPQDAIEFGVAQQVAALVPQNSARLLYLGDVYNSGTQAEFIQNTYSFDKLYGTQSNHNLLILTSAVPGQREWANRAVGYDPYWNGALAGVGSVQPVWDGDRTITNPHYYSFYLPADDGTLWKFIGINTNEDGVANGGVLLGSAMYNWLVNELNDSSVGRRKIVFSHHPRWSSDATYGDNSGMQPVWDAMQGKAMILISGHVHNYQIMNMRDSSGNVVVGGGVYQVVSGTGGTATFGFAASYLAGAINFRANNNGATRIRLYGDRAEVCFVRNDGVVLNCNSLPVATTIPPIVNAGPDQSITLPSLAFMAGSAIDTNTPTLTLTNIWTKVSGAGSVTFSDPNSLTAIATFSTAGTYVLRLTSNNGVNSSYDEMTVTVGSGAATKTIDVTSNPTGVSIVVGPSDLNGFANGVTNFTRTYLTTTSVTLTAPSTFTGGYIFVKWQRDGVDYSFGLTITAIDTINHTFNAVYTLTPEIAYPVNINSSPADGVFVSGTIIGPTPNSGYIIGGQTLTLSAPATFGGRAFVEWQLDGVTLSASRNTTDVVTAAGTYTAVYAPLATERGVVLYAVYSGAYFDTVSLVFGTTGGACTYTLRANSALSLALFSDTGAGTNTILIEPDSSYTLSADDGSGGITTATLFVARAALPSAQIVITQPVTSGGTGQYVILRAGAAPYDLAPLGQGATAGVVYTSASLVAGSYSYVSVAPYDEIESAVITNLIVDGDLSSDPVVAGWNLIPSYGTLAYNSSTPSIDADGQGEIYVLLPTLVTGKAYWFGVWYYSNSVTPNILVQYDVTILSGGVLSDKQGFLTGVFEYDGFTGQITLSYNTTGVLKILKCVLYEYDITFNATLVDPVALSATDVTTNVTCNGGGDGQIALTVTGGVAGYSFAWDKTGFPSNIYPDSATISSLDAGTYNVTITDSAGNTFSDSYVVTEPAAIVANTTVTNVTCNNADNGSILFAPSGGTGPYTYMVDGAVRANPVAGLVPGNHTYLVIDANGCTVSGTFVITEPTAVAVSLIVTNSTCYSADNGTVAVTASNGTPPYTYSYDGGSYVAGNTKGSLAAGPHTVNVKDANGCIKGSDFTVAEPTDISVIKTVVNPSYSGASDGSIALAISGGTYPIVVTWADGTVFNLSSAGSILYGGLSQGSYTATVVDANSCSKNVSQALVDDPDVPVEPPSDEDIDKMVIPLNCCRADKIYEVFKAYANGHTQLECLAVPAMTLNNKFKLLSKWYTLGQTIGGSKGVFVFTIASFNDRRISISVPGFSTVVYDGDSNINYDSNMTLFISALTMVGYDAEYESDSGYIFIYSPMNSFYNCIIPEVRISTILVPAPVKVTILTSNGFQGACTPCVTSDKFTPNCLDVNDKNKLVQDLRESCESCLCGKYIISDKL